MKYEVKNSNTGHIYSEKQLSAAIHYAAAKGLKVIERKTGKVVYPENKQEKRII